MATQLQIIAPHTADFDVLYADPYRVKAMIETLNLDFAKRHDGTLDSWKKCDEPRADNGLDEWSGPDEKEVREIYVSTPYVYSVRLYEHCLKVSTPYRYRLLEDHNELDWFDELRYDLLRIVSLFGGREAIYYPDQCFNWGGELLNRLWDGQSYGEIKQALIGEYGPPLRSFDQITDAFFQSDTNQWLLDDFAGLD